MSRPLYEKIMQCNNAVKARFCMPGHSGQNIDSDLYSAASIDWTEVAGLDNLLQSEGVIAQCEDLFAHSYGYSHALMLTGGSTCAMQIAMALAKERGGAVAAIGGMHKSFYSAARLFDVKVFSFRDIEDAKSRGEQKFSCVFATSPDYFGRLTPIEDIKVFAKDAGALLVVDEAHSAHFPFSKLLPDNASSYADIAFASMHKTLPAYGGGALLFVNDKEHYEVCRRLRAEIHSTSPNYLVMASMDYARWYMSENGEEQYAKVKDAVDRFKNVNKVGRILDNDDFTRLVIKIDGANCDKVLAELVKRGIYAEMSYGDLLVFIVTPFNCDKLDMLAKALEEIPICMTDGCIFDDMDLDLTHTDDIGATAFVDVDDAEGETCALDIGIYPPGVAIIKKGDVFNTKAINFIKKYSSKLFGLASGKVGVLK